MGELTRPKTVIVKHGGADITSALRGAIGLLGGGNPKEIFECIQEVSKGVTNVTLTEQEHVEILAVKGELEIGEVVVSFERADEKVTRVLVKNLPYEVEEATVRRLYAEYGEVKSIVRERFSSGDFEGVFNGTWVVKMVIEKDVPNLIPWENYTAVSQYPKMRKMCRSCGEVGHLAAECGKVVCFNCRGSGHRAKDCLQKKSFAAVAAGIQSSGKAPVVEQPQKEVEKPQKEAEEVVESPLKCAEIRAVERAVDIAEKEVQNTPKARENKRAITEIRGNKETFLRDWLGGKFEKDVVVTVKEAQEKGLMVQRMMYDVEIYQSVAFRPNGTMIFFDPREEAGSVKPEGPLTREKVLRAYGLSNSKNRVRN